MKFTVYGRLECSSPACSAAVDVPAHFSGSNYSDVVRLRPAATPEDWERVWMDDYLCPTCKLLPLTWERLDRREGEGRPERVVARVAGVLVGYLEPEDYLGVPAFRWHAWSSGGREFSPEAARGAAERVGPRRECGER